MPRLRIAKGSFAVLLGLGACGGSDPPPRVAPSRPVVIEPQPDSSEWIYATQGTKGGRTGECAAVERWIRAEAACKGELCRHGARLGSDFLVVCKQAMPGAIGEIRALTRELETRTVGGASDCSERVERVFREGCGKDASACEAAARKWATACARVASPFVVHMLERTIEQAHDDSRHIEIDARDCDALASELRKVAQCEKGFPCEDALPAVETWSERCGGAEEPPAAADALAAASVLAGAGRTAEPRAIQPGSRGLAAGDAPVLLEGGSGAVLFVCDERVADLGAYLQARQKCADGEIVVARIQSGKSAARTLRVGRLAHPSDAAFRARLPSLLAEGELPARDELAARELGAAVDQVVAAAEGGPAPALARLLGALAAARAALDTEPARRALGERDATLAPLLAELGRAKLALAKANRPAREVVPFAWRATRYVLADVDAQGNVARGASNPAAALDLRRALPRAVAAYEAELQTLSKRAEKAKLRDPDFDAAAGEAGTQAERCGGAVRRVENAEQHLLDCAFGVRECDEAAVASHGQASDGARAEAEDAWARMQLAIASLRPSDREGTRQALAEAGCKEPWW